jgi:hypothetical protein
MTHAQAPSVRPTDRWTFEDRGRSTDLQRPSRSLLVSGSAEVTLRRISTALAPFPPRAMASTRGLAMAEPSAGRVAVEVIVTLNHLTELATGTTATGGILGVVRCRVAIVVMLKADAVAPCASRHSSLHVKGGWSPDDAATGRLDSTRPHDRTDGLQALVRCPRAPGGAG